MDLAPVGGPGPFGVAQSRALDPAGVHGNLEEPDHLGDGGGHVSQMPACIDGSLGSDEDSADVFKRTAQLCLNAKIDLPRFSIITPFPGTPFYNELKEQGRITETDWALYDVEHVVYEPKNMTKQELLDGIEEAWKLCYSWKSIFKRFDLKRIKRWFFIYLIANIGYRKYARNFNKYDESVMTDNSDVPEPVKEDMKTSGDEH